MGNAVSNYAKGRLKQFVDAATANQTSGATVAGTTAWSVTAAGSPGIVAVLFTGTLSGASDIDAASLAALATTGTTGLTEVTTSAYHRQLVKNLASSPGVSTSTDDYIADCDDIVWGGASAIGSGTAITKLALCFVPCVGGTLVTNSGNTGQQPGGTGLSADSAIIPISIHDFAITPDGTDITATIANFVRAA